MVALISQMKEFAMVPKFKAVCLAAWVALCANAVAAAPQPVKLAPTKHHSAKLEIRLADGSVAIYTPAQLESLPTYSITTTTPWRSEPAVFEGILLTDLLDAHGLRDQASFTVIAENEFSASMERVAWEAAPILVATRVNGKPHTRRERGPIQFVIAEEDYEGSPHFREQHLVWMAAVIAAGD